MRVVLAALFAAALAACTPPQQSDAPAAPEIPRAGEDMDPVVLDITVGRYGYMLSQVEGLTSEQVSAVETPEDEAGQRRAMAQRLRETVWRYNLLRSQLCGAGVAAASSCGPALAPVWLEEAAGADVSHETLVERAILVGEAVQPFWNAVCGEAEARVADEDERRLVCAIE